MAKQQSDDPEAPDSTVELVRKARAGDRSAENEIARRNLPELRKWGRGRLPAYARGAGDTEDLAQDAVMRTLGRLDVIDLSRPGSLQWYMRAAFRNGVTDRVRRSRHQPSGELPRDVPDAANNPHWKLVENEMARKLAAARARLSPRDRALVAAWVDQEWSFKRITSHFKIPTVNAARVAVHRACERLWREMYGDAPLPKRRRRPGGTQP